MVLSSKTKKALAFAMSVSFVASAMVPMSASAQVTSQLAYDRADSSVWLEKDEETYGDNTYANRFMSLYEDVITNGVENGYLSAQNGVNIPYHCVETLNVEAPDYGHETTSEAMSYLVWVASMRDNIVNNKLTTAENAPTSSSELATAWKTMEVMVPTEQTGFWKNANGNLSAQYNNEWDDPKQYPTDAETWNTGKNPISQYFTSAYPSENGLYLLHWLADVNDWYGYGGSTGGVEDGNFTFINTFQRGAQESCWETVPHPCVEQLKYGNSTLGIKGIFNTDSQVAPQFAYTNAPDAEDRAIQGVYNANRWGVGDSSVTTLAGKMGDELRNNFFDKYYKEIGESTTSSSPSTGYESSHYLRNWYTSWGGALDGSWSWQIGCSHVHEFYQNPLATYALLADSELNAAMKGENATKDYQTSLARQLEFYLWLQSNEGPIAGGATNSWRGRYEAYPSGTSTFYGMAYVEHPVYEDPGSNHWIGNQVWALQRLSELYWDVAVNGDKSGVTLSDGTTVEQALERIMDKWAQWSVDNIKFDSEAAELLEIDDTTTWAIPASLDWSGQPDTWNNSATDNTNLHCEITAWSREVGSSASWANGLIYYAAAKGVNVTANTTTDELLASSDLGEKALGVAKKILDYQWDDCRDQIGLTVVDKNSNLTRFFEQEVWIPSRYTGTMPNGDTIATGATFFSLRTSYANDPDYERLKADYDDDGQTNDIEFYYHRFWHEGDALMANGVMATLFSALTPEGQDPVPVEDELVLDKSSVEVEVGETDTIKVTSGEATGFTSADESVATVDENGVVTGVSAGETTITVTGADGSTKEVTVTVTETTTATTTTTSDSVTTTTSDSTTEPDEANWGDVNVDGKVNVADLILLRSYILHTQDVTEQGLINADVTHDDKKNVADLIKIRSYLLHNIEKEDLAHA